MKPAIALEACSILPPRDDPYLEAAYHEPSIFQALLRRRSTIVAASKGHGKSALVWMAQRVSARDCLHVNVPLVDNLAGAPWDLVINEVSQETWRGLTQNPSLFVRLGARAKALKYFVVEALGGELVNYDLERLAEDNPDYADAINAFRELPNVGLFGRGANLEQRTSVLCDAVTKTGVGGIMVWIEFPEKPAPQLTDVVQELFDSVYQMRSEHLHIKCLAEYQVADELEMSRGVRTLSAERLNLRWTREDMLAIAAKRIRLATRNEDANLSHYMPADWAESLLTRVSDPLSPSEWIALACCALNQSIDIASTVESSIPQSRIEAEYARLRLPLWKDREGSFWRGKRKLIDLTPRKRVVYKLVDYLFCNPGYHLPYQLAAKLNMKNEAMNITVKRARDLIEQGFEGGAGRWVYLVTDPAGRGFALVNTTGSTSSLSAKAGSETQEK